ncbi:MAG: Stk1 family PASTA domain-containing Ser/Thr kinase [Oscillospiraceae bacterium]|nr:Stk1 family PASTA domain-containing Ser/Thr kinase [Oscillospiraceae bacterium]
MADKYIGKLLDNRYEILEVIGTGGMAVVYKALCHRLNRYVAVKILKDEYAKDEEFRNRFHAESHAIAMVSHPNIVAVYDVSRSNSVEYIVMELIDGMSLKQYMNRRGKLTQKEAIHFTTQILRALSHAHSKGIIHRDIKPHNIMILRDSTVRVTDFGIARLESSQKTVTREAFGSVHYIAPEQAKGSNIDCRADIYSTGVVLYEMLTGRLPYEGDTPVSIAIQHINSLPLSPREINPEIPEALEKITMKAMAPSLPKRYASTDEMIEDLENFRKNPELEIAYEPPTSRVEEDLSQTRTILINKDDFAEDEPIDETESKGNKMPLIALIAAFGIFILGGLFLVGSVSGWWQGQPNKYDRVPYLVGMSFEEASVKYSDEFNIVEDFGKREYSDEYDEGVIIKQIPDADEKVKSGEIHVTVSRGKKSGKMKIPEVYGMSEEQAKMVLERDGLSYKVESENSEEVATGNVIKTEPAIGSEVSKEDVITIYVSLGKENRVPNILGMTEEEAVAALAEVKLTKGSVGEEYSNTVEKGRVIRQDVPAGEEREEGTSVGFTISRGKQSSEQKNPTAPVTPPPADTNKKITKEIRLPDSPETFTVKITVNGEKQYEKTHKGTDGSVKVTLSGKGTSTVGVYIDEKPFQEISMDFE